MTPAEALDFRARFAREAAFVARNDVYASPVARDLAPLVPFAVPVVWSPACDRVVTAASATYPLDSWPEPLVTLAPQLHLFPARPSADPEFLTDGMLVDVRADAIHFWPIGTIRHGSSGQHAPLNGISWPRGRPIGSASVAVYGEMYRVRSLADLTDEDTQPARWLCAAWTFLHQRIVVASRAAALDRATRRRVERANLDPLVHVVTFRKAEPHAPEGTRDVEWHCQWLVRGHWRDQYYPSERANHPIWIAPYIKGPADQPMRTPAPEVWAVNR